MLVGLRWLAMKALASHPVAVGRVSPKDGDYFAESDSVQTKGNGLLDHFFAPPTLLCLRWSCQLTVGLLDWGFLL